MKSALRLLTADCCHVRDQLSCMDRIVATHISA